MMVMDAPKGYVVRLRHLKELSYPGGKKDFIPYLIPLLELAALGKVTMEDTLNNIQKHPGQLSVMDTRAKCMLPPCFVPLSPSSSSTSRKSKRSI